MVISAHGEDSNATGVNGDQSDNSKGLAGAAYVFEDAISGSTCLETTMAGRNGYSRANAGNMFDVAVVNPFGIHVTSMDVRSFDASGNVDIEVYITPVTYVGNDANAAVWTLVSTGSAPTAGSSAPTTVDVSDFLLPAGKWGMYVLHTSGGVRYSNGTAANMTASNADLTLTLGISKTQKFGGTTFAPRVWNGRICYSKPLVAAKGNYGFGCGDTRGALTLNLSAPPKLGGYLVINIGNLDGKPGPGWLWIGGVSNAGFDLGVMGLQGCSLFLNPVVVTLGFPRRSSNSVSLQVLIPRDPSLASSVFSLQAAATDPTANALGVSMSPGLVVRPGY